MSNESSVVEHLSSRQIDPEAILAYGRQVLEIEAAALLSMQERLGGSFVASVEAILNSAGLVIVTGMGKSGHIARKIAATLASTGTPGYFLHPAEASHGDLGVVTEGDVLIAISHSGETDELLAIAPALRRKGNRLIVMTGRPNSTLGRLADVCLTVEVPMEACPLGLAPTASTTAALAVGDALAVALLKARGFTEEDFARSHPAGALGRRLLLTIGDVMHVGDRVPRVSHEATMTEAIIEMSRKRLGVTAVVAGNGRLIGIFTDGDLRRSLDDPSHDPRHTPVSYVMSKRPKTITSGQLAAEGARMMEQFSIGALLVVDDDEQVVGALNFQDLLHARVI